MPSKLSGILGGITANIMLLFLVVGTMLLPTQVSARTSLSDLQNQINDLTARVEALEATVFDPDPITKAIPMVCSNNIVAPFEIFYDLTIDPLEVIRGGEIFQVAISGSARMPRWIFEAARGTIPGITEFVLNESKTTVTVREGAAGGDVLLLPQAGLPASLEIPLDGLGNVTGDLEIPLGVQTVSYIADASGEVVFDFKGLAAAPVIATSPGGDTSTRATFVVLLYGAECQSGTLNAGGGIDPPGESFLISIPIR